jgi:hypothetical protein
LTLVVATVGVSSIADAGRSGRRDIRKHSFTYCELTISRPPHWSMSVDVRGSFAFARPSEDEHEHEEARSRRRALLDSR